MWTIIIIAVLIIAWFLYELKKAPIIEYYEETDSNDPDSFFIHDGRVWNTLHNN